MLFKDLKLIEPLLKALDTEGYTQPTPIQEQAIPIVLQRHDLLGCAQTGTGKTAAFALPILQILQADRAPNNGSKKPIRSLILTPTRELAIQIGESFTAYGRNTGLRNLVIFGGVSQYSQTETLKRGTDILIATPGRLLDLMNQGYVSLRDIEIFVLDEADRMLDMGFIHDVKKVIAKLPTKRQTLFFSATMPSEIAHLADSILTNPERVAVTPVATTAEKVEQALYFVNKADKKHLLIHLLQDKAIISALVFTRTKHGANKVTADLVKAGIRAEAIHGNKSQNARQAALGSFKSGRIRVLVATDIAARGIDIEELSHVINFELPNIPETYVHRIGRTGRAGASGIALSFCEGEELPYLKDIQKLTGQTVPIVDEHPFVAELTAPNMSQPSRNGNGGGNNGRRPAPRPQQPSQRRPQAAQPQRGFGGREGDRNGRQEKPAHSDRPFANDRPARPERRFSDDQSRRPERPYDRERSDSTRKPFDGGRPAQRPESKSYDSPIVPERKSRFASILEVSKLEKQDFQRKPKPRYDKDKPSFEEPKRGNGGQNIGGRGRQKFNGSSRKPGQ